MEGGMSENLAPRGSCCAEHSLWWFHCGSTGHLASGEEVPEGNWFDAVHSAPEFCFLGANLPGGMGQKMVCSSKKSCVTAPT